MCDCSDTYRGGVGKYYLEGKREFLTAPTEWYYEPATREALWIPAAGSEAGPPTGASGRVVDFSLNITNSSFVTLANFSMFATALSVDNEQDSASDPEVAQTFSHHLRFESLELNYTTTNRAVIGDLSPPVGMTVWAPCPGATYPSPPCSGKDPPAACFDTHPPRTTDGCAGGVPATSMAYVDVKWRYGNGNTLFHRGSEPVGARELPRGVE